MIITSEIKHYEVAGGKRLVQLSISAEHIKQCWDTGVKMAKFNTWPLNIEHDQKVTSGKGILHWTCTGQTLPSYAFQLSILEGASKVA